MDQALNSSNYRFLAFNILFFLVIRFALDRALLFLFFLVFFATAMIPPGLRVVNFELPLNIVSLLFQGLRIR